MLDPVVQRQIQRLVARQVARQVAKAVEVARADIELKTDRKITEGLASMLRTVKSAAKQAPARETATAAANLSPVGRGRIDRSAHESEPALVALRQRTEQIENHVESYLRRHGQSSEELAQRVGAIERNLHDTPPRPAGPAAHPLDAEEFDVRLASVEARIEEVCHSQEQDTVHLRRQIAQVEEHGQALQVVSEPERHGLPRAQQPEHDDDLGQRQRQLEAHQRNYRDSMWRLEKRQAELESTMKRLLQNPAIATTLNGRPVPLHSSPPPESPTRDGQMYAHCPAAHMVYACMLWTGLTSHVYKPTSQPCLHADIVLHAQVAAALERLRRLGMGYGDGWRRRWLCNTCRDPSVRAQGRRDATRHRPLPRAAEVLLLAPQPPVRPRNPC